MATFIVQVMPICRECHNQEGMNYDPFIDSACAQSNIIRELLKSYSIEARTSEEARKAAILHFEMDHPNWRYHHLTPSQGLTLVHLATAVSGWEPS